MATGAPHLPFSTAKTGRSPFNAHLIILNARRTASSPRICRKDWRRGWRRDASNPAAGCGTPALVVNCFHALLLFLFFFLPRQERFACSRGKPSPLAGDTPVLSARACRRRL